MTKNPLLFVVFALITLVFVSPAFSQGPHKWSYANYLTQSGYNCYGIYGSLHQVNSTNFDTWNNHTNTTAWAISNNGQRYSGGYSSWTEVGYMKGTRVQAQNDEGWYVAYNDNANIYSERVVARYTPYGTRKYFKIKSSGGTTYEVFLDSQSAGYTYGQPGAINNWQIGLETTDLNANYASRIANSCSAWQNGWYWDWWSFSYKENWIGPDRGLYASGAWDTGLKFAWTTFPFWSEVGKW